jgi:transposase
MTMFAGLDVGGKRTAMCVVDEAGKIVWRGMVDTHPRMLAAALKRFDGKLAKVGLESGPFTPHLFRALAAMGYPMVCMDARRAADAIKSRRIKSDKADAFALAEMLRTGWFSPVHVKSLDSHRLKTLLGARDQLVKAKRSLGNQVRGLLRPFGIRLPSRVGAKRFAEAAMRPALCVRVALLFPDCRSERYRDLLVFRARVLALPRCALRYRRRPDRAQYVAERIWDQSETRLALL